MKSYILVIQLVILLLIGGCTHNVQTTSGSEYLKKYENTPVLAGSEQSKDENREFSDILKKTADVEPLLTFPARIGIARIENGQLSSVPDAEYEAWLEAKDKLGKNFGEFIPINPLVVNLASASVYDSDNYQTVNTVNKIRLGAARQHLDAVLVYEVYSKSSSKNNILAVGNLSIIGGFILPSQQLKAEGFANAILIDVIQGYPYGTVQAIADKEDISTLWNERTNLVKVEDRAKTTAVIKLIDEIEEMFMELRLELAEKRMRS